MRRLRRPPSLREALEQSLAAQKFLAGSAPAEKRDIAAEQIARLENELRARAARRWQPRNVEQSEADIQRAILRYLRLHPKVEFAGRFNRGAVAATYKGRTSFVRFNTIEGFPDIHGLLRDGRALYVEVKRPGARPTEAQQQFIERAVRAGAVAIVATSLEDVQAVLDRA
jgi:hypothetical protein